MLFVSYSTCLVEFFVQLMKVWEILKYMVHMKWKQKFWEKLRIVVSLSTFECIKHKPKILANLDMICLGLSRILMRFVL